MEQNWCGQKWNLYRRNTLDGKFYTLLLSFSCNVSPHVRKPRKSLGSWIPRHGSRIPGTGFQSLSVELGYWIPIVSGIPEFLDSKAQDFEFHKQKFHGFLFPHSLTWGETFLGWIHVNIFLKLHTAKSIVSWYTCNLTVTRLAQLVGNLLGRGRLGLNSRPNQHSGSLYNHSY